MISTIPISPPPHHSLHLSPMSNPLPPAAAADHPLPPPRKFPAPCWTPDETKALINVYKDRWYSLCCRNLRSPDWDAVAADLFARSPPSPAPAKTSAQCRHKMEKLRKRYRTDKQRALAHPNRFLVSSWAFFDLMDSLETGSCSNGGSGSNLKVPTEDDSGKFDAKFQRDLTGSEGNVPRDLSAVPIKFKFKSHGHGPSLVFDDADRFDRRLDAEEDEGYGEYESRSRPSGFFERKIGGRSDRHPVYSESRFDAIPNSGFGKNGVHKRGAVMTMDSEQPYSVVSEMVESIKMLGDGLVRMEKTKVEMVREMERMRMEMEMKRCEMILESQQLIANTFVEGIVGDRRRKKKKKVKLV